MKPPTPPIALLVTAWFPLLPVVAQDTGEFITAMERTGEEIVQVRCAECHATGDGGAPRIGERDEWVPRLNRGLGFTVRSAIHGHGAMPPRGGMADLTDPEIRAAILYMYNPAGYPVEKPAITPDVRTDPYQKVIDGTEIYLAIVAAETLRERYPAGSGEAAMHGGIPSGRGHYHLNVSLFDAGTRAMITDAQIEVTVAELGLREEVRKLERVAFGGMHGYGQYFRMQGMNPYRIKVRIHRPGERQAIEAAFEFNPGR